MTISRAQLAAYLDQDFGALADAIGQVADDDSNVGYGPDIDNALRKLGTSESELEDATVEDGNRDDVLALVEYFTARRIWRRMGDRVNTSTGKVSYNFSDQRKHVKDMMDDAARRCTTFGYDLTGSGWSVGYVNLDWLEPEEADA